MHSKLQKLHSSLNDAFRGMTLENLVQHPEGKWSTAEVLEHLNLSYTGTIKAMERCLAGKAGGSPDRGSKRWQRLAVTRLGYFPTGRQSPEHVRPRGTPPQEVVSEILENIVRMDGLIADCEARFGQRKSIADHPVLGPLTGQEWRSFHLVHGKHHAKQIARLKVKPA